MTDKRISELDAITGSNTAATDVFVVVDTSTGQTKKITREELNNAIERDVLDNIDVTTANIDGGTIDSTVIGGTTPAAGTFTSGTFTGDVSFGDNDKAIFGAGSDLQIYHDGANTSYISTSTGNMVIEDTDGGTVFIRGKSGENSIIANDDNSVRIFFDNAEKLATTSTGINVFGNATFGDNDKAIFGAGSDLQIYHDGSHSNIKDAGTGNLRLQGDNLVLQNSDATKNYSVAVNGGAIDLRHNNSVKMATTATGIDVTGTVTADGLTVDGGIDAYLNNNVADFTISDSGYLAINHSFRGGDYRINIAGTSADELRFLNGASQNLFRIAANGDISFFEDTGTTRKLYWDASLEALKIDTGGTGFALHSSSNAYMVIDRSAANRRGELVFTTASTNVLNSPPLSETTDWALGVSDSDELAGDAFYISTQSGATAAKMVITQSGSVGIGTNLPAAKLEVYGADDANNLIVGHNNTDFAVYTDSTIGEVRLKAEDGSGSNFSKYMTFYTQPSGSAAAERLRITSSGLVGIGTSSIVHDLHLEKNKASSVDLLIKNSGTTSSSNTRIMSFVSGASGGDPSIGVGITGVQDYFWRIDNSDSDNLKLDSNGTTRMTITSDGNLLVGKTTTAFGTAGVRAIFNGQLQATATSNEPLALNRLSSDGAIADFYKDSTKVGSIGVISSRPYISTDYGSDSGLRFDSAFIAPCTTTGSGRDNAIDLGDAGNRFDDIYATNGTIQTSDQNEKQDIEALSEAEQRVAVAAKGLLRKFRWIDSVEEKGDDARIHFGIIAQDLQAAFEAEGLDAGRYAMFINSNWTDEETGEERSRMGVRYNQLLAFIIAAI